VLLVRVAVEVAFKVRWPREWMLRGEVDLHSLLKIVSGIQTPRQWVSCLHGTLAHVHIAINKDLFAALSIVRFPLLDHPLCLSIILLVADFVYLSNVEIGCRRMLVKTAKYRNRRSGH